MVTGCDREFQIAVDYVSGGRALFKYRLEINSMRESYGGDLIYAEREHD
jgi:hypothetical protein